MSITYHITSKGGLCLGSMSPEHHWGIGNEAINLFVINELSVAQEDIDLYGRTVFTSERLGVLIARVNETLEYVASCPDDLGFSIDRMRLFHAPSCSAPGYIEAHKTPKMAAINELNEILSFAKLAAELGESLVFDGD